MSTALRNAIATTFLVAFALLAACAVDPTDGLAPSRGPVGALGAECVCSNGQADCDGNQGQCQAGLSCMKTDQGNQVCTHACPCPANFVCRLAGVPGARLACFKQP